VFNSGSNFYKFSVRILVC